jgi:hypothetical protein
VTDLVGQNGSAANLLYRGQRWDANFLRPLQLRGSASYVTGTHTVKVGFSQFFINFKDEALDPNAIVTPSTISCRNSSPSAPRPRTPAHINTTGIYAQDSWKINRLTLQAACVTITSTRSLTIRWSARSSFSRR